jgi:hypothetical protein
MKSFDVFKSEGGYRVALAIWNNGPVMEHSPWFSAEDEARKFAEKLQKTEQPEHPTLDQLMIAYDANAYYYEDRGSGSANDGDQPLEYDKEAQASYGALKMIPLPNDGGWASEWQKPNTHGEYDFRVIFR